MSRKPKPDGLESRVLKVNKRYIKRDEDGERYIPTCNYAWHNGVILDEDVCISRNCRNYSRAYLDRTQKPKHYDKNRDTI